MVYNIEYTNKEGLSMNKDTVIPIRLKEGIKNMAEERAKQLGMNRTEYIRWLITNDLEKNYKKD